ncbi:murein biosynthesis integral membrane protein MurJ [Kitasatospora sp. NPDC002227]|uniref:murein biosynthesis integral membrane protein MurJ n=1 Tax=Kitasatospora sp. NPDC002227 TaxID=3154773 RepID=UPI00332ADBF3
MTMNTTGEPHGSYGDPPTMPLRQIPDLPGVPPQPGHAPAAVPGPRAPQPAVQQPQPAEAEPAPASTGRNGLIMALGSLASRALGFVRSAMIVAALTTGPVGSAFNVGNSLPNIVYMMLIGGALASVFVPELVHAAQTHKDGGAAYTDRLLTLCGVVLVVLTVGAWLFAPQIVDVYSDYSGAQRDLTIAFARYCLPQIFFYGVFTLLGQVLNARDKFGAMMWTPVLNNVVAIAVFGLYIAISNHAEKAEQMTSGQTMLLGLGSTLGIVIQALGLLPSLRAAKFRYRPRFDWRGTGLAKPLRSAGWALLLVLVTQLSFAVITQLTTRAENLGKPFGIDYAGNAAYNYAYQLFVVPQGVITISLVTALLPQMTRAATAKNLPAIGADLADMLRTSAGMIIPASVIMVALAGPICSVAYLHGRMTPVGVEVISQALIAFVIGLPAFCAQYALARGFYAMGDARTPFWLTVATTGTNAGLSCVAYWVLSPRWIIIGMAGAQSIACVVSIVLTGWALGRRLRQAPAPQPVQQPVQQQPEQPAPDATMMLNLRQVAARSEATMTLNLRRGPVRSGLDGVRVVTLHVMLVLACLPGAFAGHWLADSTASALGGGLIGNLIGLGLGSLTVLASLFLLARPLGAGAAVAPLARKLRIPYSTPAVANGGKHRR